MDDTEALQLLDAYLDHESLSPDQAEALTTWLREHPEHADRAFRRIFLHTFLRQGLQYAPLPAPAILTVRREPNLESHYLQGEPLATDDRLGSGRRPRTIAMRWVLVLSVAFCLCGTAAWIGYRSRSSTAVAVEGLWAYEGFDYPPTSPPAPLGNGNLWPTSGGMQGLAGGFGWAQHWQETAPKVSVLIADVQANAWRASDMRKLRPLGYSDAQGQVLKSTGIQLRSAAGPLSATSRLLDVTAFPSAFSDEYGLGRDGAVLWISFLTQSFDGRGLGNFAYVQLGTDAAGFRLGKLAAVPSGNWSACGILDGAEMNVRWTDIPSGQPVFLVTRITFRTGGEEAEIWIDPPLNKEPSTTGATLNVSLPDFRWDQLSIKSRYTTDFDEIRIGGSFRDVAPIQ